MNAILKVKEILQNRNLDSISICDIPRPSEMHGVIKASNIIVNAMFGNKKIGIIGDYDADGVCSSFILEYFLKQISYFNFILKIPNRFIDGYGININIVNELNCDIYICVDNGIAAFEVADFIKQKNKILIIADHHKPLIDNDVEVLPNAVIINPNQNSCSFIQKEVCAAMVAWYLCAGIKNVLQQNANNTILNSNVKLDCLTPFVAIATIADMMPLISINRVFFKKGIRELSKSLLPALQYINNTYLINSQNLAFSMVPILNSAGRMHDASMVLEFFRASNLSIAQKIFNELIEINNARKQEQNKVFNLAKESFIKKENILIAYGDNWHEGVLGIVAARLVREFNVTSFCFSKKNDILKGSGRAKSGFNLIGSIHLCKEFLLHFGGHCGAVGLTLESGNLDRFISKLDSNIILDSINIKDDLVEINLFDINKDLLEILKSYEPYGMGNKELRFSSKNLSIIKIITLNNPSNKKLLLQQGESIMPAMLFNYEGEILAKSINCIFTISFNSSYFTLIIESFESL